MQIVEIDIKNSSQPKRDWQYFHGVLDTIYSNNPQYVYPLRTDIEGIFSNKNAAFATGACRLWYVQDERGKGIGRIAAFIDHQRNE
ncbi:MAG: hypothetical protein AAF828_12350, partial [Bacteroidota bacterium]